MSLLALPRRQKPRSETDGPEDVPRPEPEFPWERPLDKVKSACEYLGIPYPVALDNDFATWNKYRTRYWPTLHLIHRRDIIRYTRIGEGGYAEMEAVLRQLLDEQ